MKRLILAAAGAGVGLSGPAAAQTFYNDEASFLAAAPGVVLIEDFEDSPPALRDMALPSYTGPGGEITFVPYDSTPLAPNVWLASAGYTNFGVGLNPTTSVILTASGNEGFDGNLAVGVTAIGFNVFLNDSPFSVLWFTGGTFSDGIFIGGIDYDTPPVAGNNFGFAGVISDTPITAFRIVAHNGENINTGIDNIVVQAAIPEPGTWAMMLLGLGSIGIALRRTRRHSSCPAIA